MKLAAPKIVGGVSLVVALCAFALVWFAPWSGLVRSQRVLRVGINHSPPYSAIGPDGVPSGFSVEVIREAASRAGLSVQMIVAPEGPDRALAAHKVDIWPLLIDLPERHGPIRFTDAWVQAA